jgi:DNA polymerase I-like protein with 3'-5' exonuclease and polymerase domains
MRRTIRRFSVPVADLLQNGKLDFAKVCGVHDSLVFSA